MRLAHIMLRAIMILMATMAIDFWEESGELTDWLGRRSAIR
jgi:hypothetical protein